MNKIIPLILAFILASSCSFNTPLKFKKVSFTNNDLEQCLSVNCPNINIQYLKTTGKDIKSNKVNQHIENIIINKIISVEEEKSSISEINDAIQFFINLFKKNKSEFGDTFLSYDIDTFMEVSYQSETFVSTELIYYVYTGGAHGYSGKKFINFNAKTGELLTNETIFKNLEELKKLCENNFREVYKIPTDRSINATGFWFENDVFHLPETVGFTNTEMILHYNQYEIASYAEGPIILTIPIDEVKQYLKYY